MLGRAPVPAGARVSVECMSPFPFGCACHALLEQGTRARHCLTMARAETAGIAEVPVVGTAPTGGGLREA